MKSAHRVSVLTVVFLFANAMTVLAQVPGAKIRGDAWNGSMGQTYQSHARDYSRMLYYQAQCEEGLTPAQAQRYVGAIRENIQSANKALDKVQAAHPKDEKVQKTVAAIKKQHEKVIAHCEMIDGECKKPDGSHVAICDCCVDAEKDLDAAIAETEALLKHLKAEKLPELKKSGAPNSVATKKDAPKKVDKPVKK